MLQLWMTRLMLEILPNLKVIVLTGYDDFKYAQKSCSLGVKDFILKPVDEHNLMKSIKLQVENISNEIQSALKYNMLSRKKMLENQQKLEESFIKLIERSIDQSEIVNIFDGLNFEDDCDYQVAFIVPKISSDSVWNQHKRLLLMSVKSFFIKMIDSNNAGWTFENRDGNIIVIFSVNPKNNDTEEQISKLQDIIEVEFEVALNVGIGPVVSHISKIKFSYDQARENYSRLSFSSKINDPGVVQEDCLKNNDKLTYYKERILENFHDTEVAKKYLKRYISEVRSLGLQKSSAVEKFYDLASAFYWKYLNATGHSADGRLETLISTFQNSDIENCSVFIEMFVVKLMYFNKKQMHEIVEVATQYINQHLTDDLTVFTLAEQFHVARNYFSRLFKKEMGEGCNEYITRKRIEKAKQLLAVSKLRTYEIAEQVGYNDTNYFSLAFKKNTGVSPKEFRDRMNNPE